MHKLACVGKMLTGGKPPSFDGKASGDSFY